MGKSEKSIGRELTSTTDTAVQARGSALSLYREGDVEGSSPPSYFDPNFFSFRIRQWNLFHLDIVLAVKEC